MRWADLDLLGHVNNVVYVDYLQEARVDMMRSHGPAVRSGEDGPTARTSPRASSSSGTRSPTARR